MSIVVQVALAPLLPDDTAPAVRELLTRMTDAMAA